MGTRTGDESAVTVWLPGVLREHAGGQRSVSVPVPEPATVGDVFDRLAADLPALERRVRDEQGRVRQHVNVFVGQSNIRDADLLATPAPRGVEISIIPAVSGGA